MLKTLPAVALTAFLLPGCVDDAYDLDNINTDVEVKVNDLVVPVKLDAIKLSNVFDLDEGSVVKDLGDMYAVVVDGKFESQRVDVSAVTINPGSINPIVCDIFKYDGTGPELPSVEVGEQAISYVVTQATTSFSFSCSNVDKTIQSLKKIKGDWTININLSLSDANRLFTSLEFQKLVLNLPDGLHVTNYACADGKVSIGNTIKVNMNGLTAVQLKVDEIDFTKFNSNTFTFTPATGDVNNGVINFNGTVGVESGYVVGTTRLASSSEMQKVILNVTPNMGSIYVHSVSGVIAYNLPQFTVADVTLSDLPDMLRESGTDVSIANPQLYLTLNNPVANYSLEAEAGLTLTSVKDNDNVNVCPLDAPIVLGCNKGIAGPYNFCLSPTNPTTYYTGYENAEHVGYTRLSGLLSGSGLPDYIHVDFDNPHIIPNEVNDFKLGTENNPVWIDAVVGKYTLYAPLELTVGSTIVYEEDETGWDDETVQKITIQTLKVTATVTNTLPVDIEVSGDPLDVEGKPCVDPATGKIVKLNGFTVPAGTTANIELSNDGTIVGIDGIRYKAYCKVTKPNVVLKPDAPIELTNIKATVSGYYRDTL